MTSQSNVKRTAAAVVFSLVSATAPGFAQDGLLREGTPVRLKLNRTISSATEHTGNKVDFIVLDDVKAGDVLVAPQGSTALATVTEAVPKGRMSKGGKLNVNVDFLRLPNGNKVPLRGIQETKGGGHTGAMAGAMVGTAIVFWPAAPLFLLMHGKDITIPQGHEVTVYTDADYKLAAEVAVAPAPSPTAAATRAVLTNSDILKLKEAGFSDQLLITKIKSTPGNYHLGADDLVQLKKAGVSDELMTVMMEAKTR